MFTDTIKQGSAAVSRSAHKNPMELLVTLIDDDPTANADLLFRKWLDLVREDDEYLVPALRHTFTNMLSCLDRDRRHQNPRALPDRAGRKAHVQQIQQRVISMILMNLTLPSGKLLRDATFKECAEAGGWFVRISKKGKPNQIVGKVLTEDQLQDIRQVK